MTKEKYPMQYQQKFNFEDAGSSTQNREEEPVTKEQNNVATDTSLPPPTEASAPQLVRPDRQITYDAAPHYDWPDPQELHDYDTITVDRVVADIDGPAHRFKICRGDTVEAFFSQSKTELGEVVGISHANSEVCVRFRENSDGIWFPVGTIYPAPEPEPVTPSVKNGKQLSEVVSELNERHAPENGWSEKDRVPDTTPYTFAEFKELWKTRGSGLTYTQYVETFNRIAASEESIKEELKSTYNAKQLKAIASNLYDFHAKSNTKAANAESIYQKMLGFFLLDGSVSFAMGESYTEAVKKKVRAVTETDFNEHFERIAKKEAQREQALTNPQNLNDYHLLVQEKGEDALTDEQLAEMDRMYADITRENRAKATPSTVRQFESEELSEVGFSIKEGYHSKRNCKLWIVQLDRRIDKEPFDELRIKAKMLGGWYSSFVKDQAGFQFLDEDTATRFTELLNGDADRTDVLEKRKSRKEQTASERLHELADNLFERAEERIEASNNAKQNTARRADIQAGVRGNAFADQALARSLHSVAEALSTGKAQYLDGVRHKTHLETLDTVLYLAKWKRIREIRKAENENEYGYGLRVREEEEKPIGEQDVRFAEYPLPYLYKRHIEEAINACEDKRGMKMISNRMRKRIGRESDGYIEFQNESDIEQLRDFISRAKATGFDTTWLESGAEKYGRLQRAGIRNVREFRSALREYLPHKASVRGDDPVLIAERELIGKDLPGFFPTPRPVIEQMLEHAQIEPHNRVLEPSCGKGDIVTYINEQHPQAIVTAIEQNRTLADVLATKGIDAEFADFLQHSGSYDRIVMNPPFEKGQDIDHVRKASELLAPGGRLVSVVSEGPFFRSDSKATEFRQWADEQGAESYELADDAFKGAEAFRETGVRTRLVVIDKD